MQNDDITNQTPLYSVSQRVPSTVTNSYNSLCPEPPEWDRDCTTSNSDTNKDGSSDSSDKQTNGKAI